jgi:phosphatidylserine decarboxylase
MAWNPKSSTDNERTSILYQNDRGEKILVRQIAGFLARRVVCYAKKDMLANQGGELGFIKFGSRVDIFLPENYEIRVKIGQKVMGNVDIIANCPKTNS